MDIDKLAEAIMERIEFDRAIHKSSLVEVIQRAMQPSWNHAMPAMMVTHNGWVDLPDALNLSDGTETWTAVV